MKKPIALLFFLTSFINVLAQEIRRQDAPEPVKYTFRDVRSYFNHTVYMLPKHHLNFHIGHRFGKINGGYATFFGMDDYANTQLALDYGINDRLTLGISRIRYHRIHDLYLKYLIVRQIKGKSPLSIAAMTYGSFDGHDYGEQINEVIEPSDRLSYMIQLMIATKIKNTLSLQFSPQFVHRNLVEDQYTSNDALALNSILRINSWGITSFQVEYHVEFSDYLEYNHILSFGMNFETAKHNFALLFSNASVMDQTLIWSDPEISPIAWENLIFGFNISRRFKL